MDTRFQLISLAVLISLSTGYFLLQELVLIPNGHIAAGGPYAIRIGDIGNWLIAGLVGTAIASRLAHAIQDSASSRQIAVGYLSICEEMVRDIHSEVEACIEDTSSFSNEYYFPGRINAVTTHLEIVSRVIEKSRWLADCKKANDENSRLVDRYMNEVTGESLLNVDKEKRLRRLVGIQTAYINLLQGLAASKVSMAAKQK